MILRNIPRSLWIEGELSPISVVVGFPIRVIPKGSGNLADQPIVVRVPMGTGPELGGNYETVNMQVRAYRMKIMYLD